MDKTITYFSQLTEKNESIIHIKGKWVLSEATTIELLIQNLDKKNIKKVVLNCQDLKELDSAGSWLIKTIEKFYKKDNINVTYTNLPEKFQNLFNRIHHLDDISIPLHQEAPFIEKTLISIGEKTIIAWKDGLDLLGFFGEVLTISIRSILRPLKFRWTSLFYHIRIMGFDAVPIIGLLTFLVGIVLAYQGATQLQRFGADIYTVNLVGIATLRELGILLSAVIIAGRTGSAITAQIGTMAVNEEIDALKTMGIHPLEILVIPRIFALMIAFPLLTFFGNIMALIGGGAGCWMLLNIHPYEYIAQLKQAVPLAALWVGLSKAPVFAFVIALVGCFEGLKVSGSAESVGIHTTKSVVKSLFIIIVLDAVFSVLFTYFDI